MKRMSSAALAAALMACGSAIAQPISTSTTTPAPPSQTDQDFVTQAVASGVAELMSSQIINDLGPTSRVDAYAMQLRDMHMTLNLQLIGTARALGYTVTPQLAGDAVGAVQSLVGMNTQEAENFYLQTFGVQAHQTAIALYEAEVQNGQDEHIKAMARATLPTLKMHLMEAQKLLGGS